MAGINTAGIGMEWLITLQRWLYGGMAESMGSTTDFSGLPMLVGLAFVFGIVHAFMPGHGKSVLVSYHLGRAGQLLDAVVNGSLLALTHVGSAVVLVAAGVGVISRAVAAGGRAPAFERASAVFIALTGVYLVYRAVRPKCHQDSRDGRVLAVSTGLVPCPLTTFILTYSLARGKLAVGMVAIAGMLGGVILTIVTFTVVAVVARGPLLNLLASSQFLRTRIGQYVELAGALGVLALGGMMLAGKL
jgi:nickel/cobalt transporter (NicO) family protein